MAGLARAEATRKIERASEQPAVPFSLLGGLVYTFPSRTRRQELIPGAIFAAAHLLALLLLRQASLATTAPPTADLATVTYLDVPPPVDLESPRSILRPRPIAVSEAVIIPAAQGEVVHPEKPAGFQELLPARDLPALPPPVLHGAAADPVDERDYGGRGVIGGVAGGKPVPVLPAGLAAELAQEGRLSDNLAAARPIAAELADVKPQLLNRAEMAARLLAAYPPLLRAAGLEGSALVEFVVETTGQVRTGSLRVVFATDPRFVPPALEVLRHGRFAPARMSVGGKLMVVAVMVRMPLVWKYQEKGSGSP